MPHDLPFRKDTRLKRIYNLAAASAVLLWLSVSAFAQGGAPPFAAAAKMTCAEALKQAPKDDASLAPLAKVYDGEAAKLKKAPKDAKAKKGFIEAGVKYSKELIHGQNKLSAPVKYRAGLAVCRQVLAVDPKNADCGHDKDQIEGIYKQMGRDVPK